MTLKLIRIALEEKLNALTPKWPISWENVAFDPGIKIPHMRAFFQPARTEPSGFGENTWKLWQGDFQISVMVPRHGGTMALHDRAELVMNHFPRGLGLTSGSVTVTCEQPYGAPVLFDGEWAALPVTVPWFTYLP